VPESIQQPTQAATAERPVWAGWSDAIVSMALLGSAVAVRIAMLAADRLDFDEYALMTGVGRSLRAYAQGLKGSFGLGLLLHYWVTCRLIGGRLLAYRSASAILGLLNARLGLHGVTKTLARGSGHQACASAVFRAERIRALHELVRPRRVQRHTARVSVPVLPRGLLGGGSAVREAVGACGLRAERFSERRHCSARSIPAVLAARC
jgi:hypothetical protein